MAILISTNGNTKLTLGIYRFQFSEPTCPEDMGWLVGDLKLENSCFVANIENRPQFYLSELNHLVLNLEQRLNDSSGTINYQGTEPYLTLSVELKPTGNAQIKGEIWDVDHNNGKLCFEFESDQTCLRLFCKELKSILADFNTQRKV